MEAADGSAPTSENQREIRQILPGALRLVRAALVSKAVGVPWHQDAHVVNNKPEGFSRLDTTWGRPQLTVEPDLEPSEFRMPLPVKAREMAHQEALE